ncbi:MAG: helix-hairpin-helix domain-containing protein [Actinomycetota bacterium]
MSLRERIAESARASRGELALLAVLGVAIVGSGLFVLLRTSDPPAPPVERVQQPVQAEAQTQSSPEPKLLVVHVAGRVANPGVYRLVEGSRVEDALIAAGGPAPEADVDALNLASAVADGQKVFVPEPGEAVPENAASGALAAGEAGKVNLNTAGQDQLESLPSVGPVKAKRIIDHREAHGPFTSPRQIMEVSGFGPKTYESLKDLIAL